ncbi:MAG: GSCFA domain-containing protein [Sphingobacteriales bacterium]|nr:MAG: GSCFA domain-containing protein [Sphingobacteriales bacterium]
MQFLLPITIPESPVRLRHSDRILLLGSCFTEHISSRLSQTGFQVVSNPQGILFNPISTAQALENILMSRQWTQDDLFSLNGLWNSWQHHSRFSNVSAEAALSDMNAATSTASQQLPQTNWIIITLGTAFQYVLQERRLPVANNHRAPGQWFEKQLLTPTEITSQWSQLLTRLFAEQPQVKVIFTVSPVRHARDGAIANNRSKGRLLDAVHNLCEAFPEHAFYFPAYELVVDVLRDYRFYDIDLIHPNHAATSYVWEQFIKYWIDPAAIPIMEKVAELNIARNHKPRFPETEAHQSFRKASSEKAIYLQQQYPWLQLAELIAFFK